MPLPRMRTIKEAAHECREIDPHTAITEKYIRRLVITGQIPYVKSGAKYLLNMDKLESFFEQGQEAARKPVDYGTIRKIVE